MADIQTRDAAPPVSFRKVRSDCRWMPPACRHQCNRVTGRASRHIPCRQRPDSSSATHRQHIRPIPGQLWRHQLSLFRRPEPLLNEAQCNTSIALIEGKFLTGRQSVARRILGEKMHVCKPVVFVHRELLLNDKGPRSLRRPRVSRFQEANHRHVRRSAFPERRRGAPTLIFRLPMNCRFHLTILLRYTDAALRLGDHPGECMWQGPGRPDSAP